MNDSYNEFLEALEIALEKRDFKRIDEVLQTIHSGWLSPKDVDALGDIIDESTLYIELKESEYLDQALEYIQNLKI